VIGALAMLATAAEFAAAHSARAARARTAAR
jgi:hypothetical protein